MTVPDVILRLARRHLPIDAVAPEHAPALPEHELFGVPVALNATGAHAPANELADSSDATASDRLTAAAVRPAQELAVPSSTPPTFSANAANPAASGYSPARPDDIPQRDVQVPPAEMSAAAEFRRTETPPQLTRSNSGDSFNRNDSVVASPADDQTGFQPSGPAQPEFAPADDFVPSFPAWANQPSAGDDRSGNLFEPLDRTDSAGARSHDQSPVDAVGESGRQLEESARDLESSLTRLFTTQIETLQRLRDTIAEHERRWVEQQSARRAAL